MTLITEGPDRVCVGGEVELVPEVLSAEGEADHVLKDTEQEFFFGQTLVVALLRVQVPDEVERLREVVSENGLNLVKNLPAVLF